MYSSCLNVCVGIIKTEGLLEWVHLKLIDVTTCGHTVLLACLKVNSDPASTSVY